MGADDRSRDLSVLHLVKQVQYKAYVQLEAILQPFDVTAVQFRILTTLSTREDLTSAELARLYDVKPQTMIKQIALLEAKGLIERHESAANRRLLEVSLTTAGREALDRLQVDARALEARLLQPLTREEREVLAGYLVRLLDGLGADPGTPDAPGDAEDFTAESRRPGVQRL